MFAWFNLCLGRPNVKQVYVADLATILAFVMQNAIDLWRTI